MFLLRVFVVNRVLFGDRERVFIFNIEKENILVVFFDYKV